MRRLKNKVMLMMTPMLGLQQGRLMLTLMLQTKRLTMKTHLLSQQESEEKYERRTD